LVYQWTLMPTTIYPSSTIGQRGRKNLTLSLQTIETYRFVLVHCPSTLSPQHSIAPALYRPSTLSPQHPIAPSTLSPQAHNHPSTQSPYHPFALTCNRPINQSHNHPLHKWPITTYSHLTIQKLTPEDLAKMEADMSYLIEDDVVTKEEIMQQTYKPISAQLVAQDDRKPWQKLAAELECRLKDGDKNKKMILEYMTANKIVRKDNPSDEDQEEGEKEKQKAKNTKDKEKEKGKGKGKREDKDKNQHEDEKGSSSSTKGEKQKDKEKQKKQKEKEIKEREEEAKKKKQIKDKEKEEEEHALEKKNTKKANKKKGKPVQEDVETDKPSQDKSKNKKKVSPRKSADAEIISVCSCHCVVCRSFCLGREVGEG
jgi:hypothetical protein